MSDYNVKYRPQKISELDLISIREGLAKVLKSVKIPHAFLFAGPRGTGKTSAARIVAKVVNCTGKREKGEPCNQCEQCLSITIGNNLDVLEIDAASNRGIDDIRDLREKVKLVPSSAFFKVYIIDEVHMLTTEAFNALLKTLEEPPKHVIFILCTTEPEKLPATIISRCTRFNFKKANEEEVVKKLKKIVLEESLEVKPEAIGEIARGASGSFRDALKILELATFSEGEIGSEQIKEILGQTVGLAPGRLLEEMLSGDTQAALNEIKRVVESGANLRIYTTQVLELLRGMLLGKLGIGSEGETVNPETQKLVETLKIEEIKTLIELFSRAAQDLKEAIIPQLPLELAVVEWCEKGDQISNIKNQKSSEKEGEKPIKEEGLQEEKKAIPITREGNKKLSLGEIQERWREVLSGVRPKNFSIEAFLRACRPIAFDGQFLTIEVFYQFHKDKLESEKCRVIVEEVVSQIFGTPLALRCTLAARPQAVKKEEPVFGEQFSEESLGKTKPGNGETTEEDIIKVAEEIFNGQGAD